jgi:hypothetical protein
MLYQTDLQILFYDSVIFEIGLVVYFGVMTTGVSLIRPHFN